MVGIHMPSTSPVSDSIARALGSVNGLQQHSQSSCAVLGAALNKLRLEQVNAISIAPEYMRHWVSLLQLLPAVARHELGSLCGRSLDDQHLHALHLTWPTSESAACFGLPEQSAVGQPKKELAAQTAGLEYSTLTATACTQRRLASMWYHRNCFT